MQEKKPQRCRHPPPRLQLHDTLLSGRALDRVDQLVARHRELEVHLESRARREGVCRAPVGLGHVARRTGRRALGDKVYWSGIGISTSGAFPLAAYNTFGPMLKARGVEITIVPSRP